MDINAEKLKLIAWLTKLKDEEVIGLLTVIKDTYLTDTDVSSEAVVNEATTKYSTKDIDLNKQELFMQIKDLPDTFSLDFLLDRLIFLKKLNVGLEQSEHGEGITNQEMDKLMQSWFK